MTTVDAFNDLTEISDSNQITVNPEKSFLQDSTISFDGKNNIVYIEDGVKIVDSKIELVGDNSVLYLSSNWHNYLVDLSLNNQSTVYIGRMTYFNERLTAITSEGRNIIIGDDGLFSRGVCIRVADPHLLYDAQTKERINPSKSVFIGDHTWIGQDAMLLKGTTVGSGSVIGAASVVSGRRIESNTVYAGNPAKKIKSGVFFEKPCVHQWTDKETEANRTCDKTEHIYGSEGKGIINTAELDEKLHNAFFADARLEIIKKELVSNRAADRFYIPTEEKSSKKRNLFKR